MNIDDELSRFGLTRQQYEAVMSDILDKQNGVSNLEWNEIAEKHHLKINGHTLRKECAKPFGGGFAKEYYEMKQLQKEAPTSYLEQMAELRREKQKLYDERTAWNKLQREGSRYDQVLEYLEKLIRQNQYKPIAPKFNHKYNKNDLLIMISDIHYGLNATSSFGEYNADIAKCRMNEYLEQVLKIQNLHCSENAYILLGGDLVNGNIHQTTQLQNRENVVEQVQGVSEMIAFFIYELSKRFSKVYLNSVSGNHSRMNKKDMVLRDERLDSLVPWYLKAKLSNIKNVVFVEDQYDPTIAYYEIRGNKIVGVHGDMDGYSESGVSKLTMMLNFKPHAVLYGHLHKCSYDDISGVRLVRSGSFCGTVDDYTISKRITGHASQMVCVVDKDGIQSLYPVNLH